MHSNRNALAWIRRHWERNAEIDPLWSIVTQPDKSQRRWTEEEFFATGDHLIDQHLKRLAASSIELRKAHALDFGCGVGRLTRALGRHFETVVGVDISENMLSLARKLNHGHANLQFLSNEAPDLKLFRDRSFDFISCLITLQHIPPAFSAAYLGEFIRILDTKGILLVQVITRKDPGLWYWPPSLVKRLWRALNSLILLRTYMEMHVLEESKVRSIVESAGARILEAWPDDSGGGRFESRVFVIQRT